VAQRNVNTHGSGGSAMTGQNDFRTAPGLLVGLRMCLGQTPAERLGLAPEDAPRLAQLLGSRLAELEGLAYDAEGIPRIEAALVDAIEQLRAEKQVPK
jgi:hypothetical protein